ncbi:MAG: pilus assembly protein PilP [Candidatus Aminicenantes bacterium]|nr:pilus assembly protein PilP [Candidatus Aminicenantes bacterium]
MKHHPGLRVLLLLLLGCARLAAVGAGQEEPKAEETAPVQPSLESAPVIFTSAGKRDPFKDLLAGTEVADKSPGGKAPQVSIDDLVLIGIVRERGKLYALVTSGPQGFPHRIQRGDRFSDGYVVSVGEANVLFRKTSDRGITLPRPRDVIKEISQEEP